MCVCVCVVCDNVLAEAKDKDSMLETSIAFILDVASDCGISFSTYTMARCAAGSKLVPGQSASAYDTID